MLSPRSEEQFFFHLCVISGSSEGHSVDTWETSKNPEGSEIKSKNILVDLPDQSGAMYFTKWIIILNKLNLIFEDAQT